MMMMTVFVCVW